MQTETNLEPKEVVVLVNETRIPEKDIFGDPLIEDGNIEKKVELPPKKDEQDEAVELLRNQLAEKQREAEEAKRMRAQAEAYARERDAEVHKLAVHAQDNQHTAFINAIASFERDAEMLENEYANRLANGDYQNAAKIQRQMAQVEGKLAQLHQGKEAIEERLAVVKQTPQQQYQPQEYRDPMEESLNKLTPSSRAWVENHPEVLTDPEYNARMSAAHHSAVKNKITPDSREYFEHLDREMGYSKRQTPSRQQKVVTAAPVSRGGTVDYRSNGQVGVTLSPEQRAYAAEVLGISDEEYAEGMIYYANKGKMQI